MEATSSVLMKIGGRTSLQCGTEGSYELEANLVSNNIRNNKYRLR